MIRFIIISASIILSTPVFSQSRVFQNVSVKEFKEKMEDLQNELVIDLRTNAEVKQGTIPEAVQIDFFGKEFEKKLSTLDKQRVYLIYCESGGRSNETLELMDKMGFMKVYALEKGFHGWKKDKMPIYKP